MRASGLLERDVRRLETQPAIERDEFISFDLAIPENRREQSRTDCLTGVDGYDGSTTVEMTKEVVAALDSRDLEPGLR
jgi:hypothetical protein